MFVLYIFYPNMAYFIYQITSLTDFDYQKKMYNNYIVNLNQIMLSRIDFRIQINLFLLVIATFFREFFGQKIQKYAFLYQKPSETRCSTL